MEKAVFDDYVENRYKKQMEFYSKSSAKNQKKYRQYQWILIILSALTPVLAAINTFKFTKNETTYWINADVIQIILVVISAIVAILTTGLKTFNYYELWVNYRSTYEKLKPEIHYYNFSVGPYAATGVDKESLFVTRVESLLDAEHKQWPPAKKLQEDQNKPKENGDAADTKNEDPAHKDTLPENAGQPAPEPDAVEDEPEADAASHETPAPDANESGNDASDIPPADEDNKPS